VNRTPATTGAALALLCALGTPAGAQDGPFFYRIGSLGGDNFSSNGAGVSADGSTLTGESYLDAHYPTEAIIWTRETGVVSITPGRHADAGWGGINGTGTVVTGGFIGNQTHWAFRWTAETGAVSLGDLDGGEFRSVATGVSARGDIVVGAGASADTNWEAFRWTAETGMVGLGDLPGGRVASAAEAVSADGRVIVGGGSVEGGGVAFRWTAETGMVSLGDLPGGSLSATATDVSADGSVVIGNGSMDDGRRAFRWTAEDGMVPLEKIHPDQRFSRAYATSWDGSIILGELSVSGVGSGFFYWTEEDGMRWLDDVFAEHGVPVPDGWVAYSVRALSADGRTIVGTGTGGGFIAHLGPACRADFDKDGAVTPADALAYLAAWQQRSIFADFNYDGYINTHDLIAFINAWAAGC
jgi:probable HAF family extracellular repeat protein